MTQRENRVLVVVETFSAISGEKPSTSSWGCSFIFLVVRPQQSQSSQHTLIAAIE
jgi:hypothetical protein